MNKKKEKRGTRTNMMLKKSEIFEREKKFCITGRGNVFFSCYCRWVESAD